MPNIVALHNPRGFTRMDNSLMEALATVDLPARELRVLMAIARQTIGYQLETKRLTADDIGKQTNLRRDVTSKAISHLLERRIIFRVGGSRGDIGIAPVREWSFFEEKQQRLTETKTSHSANIVSLRPSASETKTAHSLLYTKKEPLLTLSSKEINPPQEPVEPPKPDRKAPFGMAQLLADNPHNVPEQLLADWLTQRKAKRAAVTATVWSTVNTELDKCAEAGITAEDAITEALNSGWQGFKASWVIKRLAESAPAPAPQSRHTGFAERNYTDGLIQREDGSYAI
ncbi:replication protein [Pseudomonas sp. Leaf15]|uniref:replication protein n=1 Tax=unclassified Pseudomonas TaxID=196821 RepID=UPI000703B53F|nr:replication protein [Pseudomonas sp. Leaf98]KQM46438.1 replication protein [Pseudomonas sp. Leaf15]MDQ0703690.1 phage replication O-like protein O [Pseudomonas sp. W3I7]RAH01632.1 replication protein [Pseudomonas sp. Leaf98]